MKKYNKPIFLKGDYTGKYDFTNPSNYLPLPTPQTRAPYHLNLEDMESVNDNELTFHLVGDTGSFRDLDAQQKIAGEIIKNANQDKSTDFLYHLGDVVYHHGEESEYSQQFFEPYEKYPGPIFAIAGNHDADINPYTEVPYNSLDAFMQVFCNSERKSVPFSNGSSRKSMTQPYVYWTLKTPLVNIIGLYGNVAKFGLIDAEQRKWFIEELKSAGLEQNEKAIFIAVHQSPFSVDINHGSSLYMIDFLESAYQEAGVIPDMVFSGHVHNYQRFHKTYENDKVVPYIVAGAGGYAILHPIAEINDPQVSDSHTYFDSVTLDSYCDDKHGFLKINLKRSTNGLCVNGEYFVVSKVENSEELETSRFDSFEFSLDRFKEEAEFLV
jgi:calcineurin-like phosphoesterase family protein